MSEYFEKLEMDREQGNKKEQEVKKLLENLLNCELFKTSRYHFFDFLTNNEQYFEIKSRNNLYEKWPTTIVGLSKILYAKQNKNKQFFFVFMFEDCVKYVKYNEELFDSFQISKKTRTDRGKTETNSYVSIPIQFLKNLEYIISEL